jgi:uncharacterized cupin superfamily protein
LVNVFADDWDVEQSRPGFTWKRKRIAGEMIGMSVYELPPGEKSFPYHLHHGNEELLVVLAGTPTLRTSEGERAMSPGDAVVFRRGADGAHQVQNDSGEAARYLMISTLISPDVTEFPDSDKVGAMARPPGERNRPGLVATFPLDSQVDYFEGE